MAEIDPPSSAPAQSIVKALGLATLGSFLTAFSFMMFKLANTQVDNYQKLGGLNWWRQIVYLQPLWLVGLSMLISGQVVNTWALEYGNVILLSSTSTFTLVFNSILAPLLLGERFEWASDGATIAIILAGSTLCLLNQPQDEAQTSSPQTSQYGIDFLLQPHALVFSATFIGFQVFTFFKSSRCLDQVCREVRQE